MQPPTEPVEPAEGDYFPYPSSILALGGNRWLSMSGRVLTQPLGNEVEIEPGTRNYWEKAAIRGGHPSLADLIV
ncbi:hypothetical protein SEA_ANON_3 [Gordonia phage Anon]|nr:hypothetical protein SEA_ANON_3 [Gordonia phage Anon]